MQFKRLIICSDGTWQKMEKTYPTNVAKMYNIIIKAKQPNQQLFYDPGVGTSNWFSKWFGGIFGWGLNKNIMDCYIFLCKNYRPGDTLYLFGFSRGAYTVRSLAGLIYQCGIVKTNRKKDINRAMKIYRDSTIHPNHKKAIEFRKQFSFSNPETDNRPFITFLGCWDTVGALGVPDLTPKFRFDERINKKYKFHDLKLSEIILNACHAVALDEHRKIFDVTPMLLSAHAQSRKTKLDQIWFIGDHGCIGGGDKDKESLSDISFHWMVQQVLNLESSLKLDMHIQDIPTIDRSNFLTSYDTSIDPFYKALGTIQRTISNEQDALHWTIKKRLMEDGLYKPQNKGIIIEKAISERISEYEEATA